MKQMLIGLLAGTVMVGCSVQAQEFAEAPANFPRLVGADLYIDLAQYVGKQVVITDAEVFGANNGGALMIAGRSVHFKITTEGLDRETFRYFLKNCNGLGGEGCKMHLLATPTGKGRTDSPELADVKIVR